jgi:hypothetical protein
VILMSQGWPYLRLFGLLKTAVWLPHPTLSIIAGVGKAVSVIGVDVNDREHYRALPDSGGGGLRRVIGLSVEATAPVEPMLDLRMTFRPRVRTPGTERLEGVNTWIARKDSATDAWMIARLRTDQAADAFTEHVSPPPASSRATR